MKRNVGILMVQQVIIQSFRFRYLLRLKQRSKTGMTDKVVILLNLIVVL